MPTTSVVTYQYPEGRQTRRVLTGNGTPGEIAEALAGEHRCLEGEIVLINVAPAGGSLKVPVTTGGPNVDPLSTPEGVDAALQRYGFRKVEDDPEKESTGDDTGRRGGVGSSGRGLPDAGKPGDGADAEGATVPAKADIHGMRKPQLYDLAALHSVPVDDDPTVAELKQRLIAKLHP